MVNTVDRVSTVFKQINVIRYRVLCLGLILYTISGRYTCSWSDKSISTINQFLYSTRFHAKLSLLKSILN